MSADSKRKPILVRIINMISEISGYLSGIALFAAALIIFYKVVVRYFFGLPTVWQTEMSIYLLMFTAFVGAAYGLKHHAHVNVDIIQLKLPPRARLIVQIICSVLGLAVTILVAWRGWSMWWMATEKGWHSESLWGPSLSIPYFILPLGMTCVALQFLVLIYEQYMSFKNGGEKDIENGSHESV